LGLESATFRIVAQCLNHYAKVLAESVEVRTLRCGMLMGKLISKCLKMGAHFGARASFKVSFICLHWCNNFLQYKLRGLSPLDRNIPTERPPLVREVSANFCG
jgi:hypothetical protein